MKVVHRRSDRPIPSPRRREKAHPERALPRWTSVAERASLTPRTRRRVGLFAAAFALATGAFWATMLTAPPLTEASGGAFSVLELQRNAPLDLPMGGSDAH